MKKKIIAFAGSNSSVSINKRLVKYTLESFQDYDVEFLDLNDFEMPIYSYDREKASGVPQLAHDFRQKMYEADGIIISLAEHNGNLSVALKNILDWSSRVNMNIFNERKMLLLSTSPGRRGGAGSMQKALEYFPFFKADIVDTFSLPSFNHAFADGKIVDEELRNELAEKVEKFKGSL